MLIRHECQRLVHQPGISGLGVLEDINATMPDTTSLMHCKPLCLTYIHIQYACVYCVYAYKNIYTYFLYVYCISHICIYVLHIYIYICYTSAVKGLLMTCLLFPCSLSSFNEYLQESYMNEIKHSTLLD